MKQGITQRTALVTGGTGGIGTALVRYLARQGHRVATNYRDEARAAAWREDMIRDGIDVVMVPGDVSDPVSAESMIRSVEDLAGPVEILVTMPASRATPPSTRWTTSSGPRW